MSRTWTDEELHLLRSRYPTHGAERVSLMLKDRSPSAVRSMAKRLGLSLGEINGWTPISYLARETGLSRETISERAKRQDVHRTITNPDGYPLMVLVPDAWGEALIRMIHRGRKARSLRDHNYDLRKTARIFGVHPKTIQRWLYGKSPSSRGQQAMDNIRVSVIRGVGRQYYFNPFDVEREARKYREQGRD